MSRIEKLLKAIINNTTYDEPRLSRIEEIFYSILYSLPYNADAQSRIEALLLALKESGLYDERTLSRIEEILKCKLDGSTYTGWIGSRVEMLLNEWELSEIIEATFTSFPIIIKANGEPLLDYTTYGNTVQNGTPTPENPIQPSECGERTGNLANMYGIDATGLNLTFKTDSNMTVKINGTKQDGVNIRDLAHPNIILPAGKYTAKIKMIGGSITNITGGVMFGINKSDYGMRTAPQVNTVGQVGTRTFTLNSDTLLTSLDITPSYGDAGAIFNDAVFQCWLYSGDGDVPYEPYGYKIPISSANTTTPVYLGEVETTRRVKKLVLTGEEKWELNNNKLMFYREPFETINYGRTVCTHYINAKSFAEVIATTNSVAIINVGIYVNSGSTDIAYFKSYLAAQYAAGTPVTVWYVLAEPETAVVNEPLMKIGEYADTLSMEQAGVDIPTNNGNTVIDVDTALKPSEMYIKYNGEGTHVYITADNKLYITSNNEIYVLKR